MATSRTAITPRNIHTWLASLGYLFPSNEGELARFERLYADMVIPEEELLDPDVVMGKKQRSTVSRSGKVTNDNSFESLRMAARNGTGKIPQHIFDKMKNNHKKPKDGNDGADEKKSD